MTNRHYRIDPWYEGLITALSIGGFFIILGAVFGLTPGIPQKTVDFFGDFGAQHYPFMSGTIVLPAPAHPAAHMDFYTAVVDFMIGIGILQVVVLALRVFFHSPLRRISNSIGDLIFWFGGAAAANAYLLAGTLNGWFTFWATILIILGVSLIVRGIIYLFSWRRHEPWW